MSGVLACAATHRQGLVSARVGWTYFCAETDCVEHIDRSLRVLTGVDSDAALRAADEEAGSIVLQVRHDGLLLPLRVLLRGGGEAHLWDQRFGPHPPTSRHHRTVHAGGTFGLPAGKGHNMPLTADNSSSLCF